MLIPYNEAPFVDKSVASYLEAVWVILAYLDFATLPFPPHELGRKWSQNICADLFILMRIRKGPFLNKDAIAQLVVDLLVVNPCFFLLSNNS